MEIEPDSQPLGQELENRCRKVINAALKSASPTQKQVLAKRLGQLKKDFVQQVCPKDRPASQQGAQSEGAMRSAEELSVTFLGICRHTVGAYAEQLPNHT